MTDVKVILKMAKAFGVKDENLYHDQEPDAATLKKTYMAILKASRAMSSKEEPHIIMVYCGGHGATQNEKQVYLLNCEKAQDAMFQLEFKLRYLVQDALSYGRVFAVFDCCRVQMSNMPGLATGRGAGGNEGEEDEESGLDMCKYFHIQACGPGGIADADGGFANRLYAHCEKMTNRNPKGYMEWPRDWMRVRWTPGEMCNSGGEDYLVPFKPEGF